MTTVFVEALKYILWGRGFIIERGRKEERKGASQDEKEISGTTSAPQRKKGAKQRGIWNQIIAPKCVIPDKWEDTCLET